MLNKKGFTLIEIMIASAITMVGLLTVWGLFKMSTENYNRATSRVEAKEALSIFADRLTRIFSYSQYIIAVSTPATISNSIPAGAPGQVSIGKWNDLTTNMTAGSWVLIANFRRETGRDSSITGNRRSHFQQTGIFYRTPTPTTSGVLFIDYGNATNAPMSPSYSDIFIPNIVELEIDSPELTNPIGGIQYLKSFRLQITIRDYSTINRAGWRWCPVANLSNVANCSTTASFKDLKQDFYVNLYNSILAAPDAATNNLTIPERVLGSVYLFPVEK